MVKYVRIKCAAGAIFFVHTAVLRAPATETDFTVPRSSAHENFENPGKQIFPLKRESIPREALKFWVNRLVL